MNYSGNSDTLRLYRGDSTKIKEFDFNKTYKQCLFGPGIYLTDDLELANSYRTKGSNFNAWDPNLDTSVVAADTLNEAKAQYHQRLIDHLCECHYRKTKVTPGERKVFMRENVIDVDDLIAEGSVTFTRDATSPGNAKRFRFDFKYRHKGIAGGYLTVFDFPKKHLESNVIKIDADVLDKDFLEIIFHNNLLETPWEGTYASFLMKYGERYWNPFSRSRNFRLKWEKAIKVFQPYGIYGYQYRGGMRAGWRREHRAFVIWDDEFVNRHKVERFR